MPEEHFFERNSLFIEQVLDAVLKMGYNAFKQGKYARRYLVEAQYRFNRRFRLAEMLPRLIRAMMLCNRWPEPVLRAVGNFHG